MVSDLNLVLSCVISLGIRLKNAHDESLFVELLPSTVFSSINQAILRLLLFAKGIDVADFSIDIYSFVHRTQSYDGNRACWLTNPSHHCVFSAWGNDCCGHLEILRRLWENDLKRKVFNPDMYPLAYFVRWSQTAVLDMNLCLKRLPPESPQNFNIPEDMQR